MIPAHPKTDALSHLQQLLDELSAGELLSAAKSGRLDSVILGLSEIATLAHVKSFELNRLSNTGVRFDRGNDSYFVTSSIATAPRRASITVRRILPREDGGYTATITQDFESPGFVNSVALSMPVELQSIHDFSIAGLVSFFSSAYNIATNTVRNALAWGKSEGRGIQEVHNKTRDRVVCELDCFFCYVAIVGDEAIFVLDQMSADRIVRTVKSHEGINAVSAFSALASVGSQIDPYDQIFASEAIPNDRLLLSDLGNAKYAETGLNVIEQLFFGTSKVAVQPVLRDETLKVVALYPASCGQALKRMSSSVMEQRAEIAESFRSTAKVLSQRIRDFEVGDRHPGLFVPRPVSPLESSLSFLRNSRQNIDTPKNLQVDERSFSIRWQGKVCRFSSRESQLFRLVACLLNQRLGQYVDELTLNELVWLDVQPEHGSIKSAVSRLRKKLRKDGLGGIADAIHTRSDGGRISVGYVPRQSSFSSDD